MDARAKKDGTSDAVIYDRIWSAIADRRLGPGTRLKEEQLSEIFSVNRARIRSALQKLARDGLVTLVPNRGAFVAEPSIEEARDVFFARRTIEERLIQTLCENVDEDAVATLRTHVEKEREAHKRQDNAAAIHLSGAFHILIAELAGSPILTNVLRDLISRTSLITAMYQPRDVISCGPDEHAAIVDMIARSDARSALSAMQHHLSHIEERIRLDDTDDRTRDLRDILTGI